MPKQEASMAEFQTLMERVWPQLPGWQRNCWVPCWQNLLEIYSETYWTSILLGPRKVVHGAVSHWRLLDSQGTLGEAAVAVMDCYSLVLEKLSALQGPCGPAGEGTGGCMP